MMRSQPDKPVSNKQLDKQTENNTTDSFPQEIYQALCAEYEDKLLRLRAEIDNQKKRSARELEKAEKYAISGLLEALLPVRDSMELGFNMAMQNASVPAILEGMKLTLNQFESVLGRFGVSIIDPSGQLFNPKEHEAMSIVETNDVPVNTVVEVFQKGYRLQDRLIRPALVSVSKSSDRHGGKG
ncbi:MAG: nucleotide exchange factor GrpE [Flavobacteriaceae bacterium TMED42]|nr:MAG: nucleotide exchange factor GrpE [Flavobacteriaceae bacterium TMED42]